MTTIIYALSSVILISIISLIAIFALSIKTEILKKFLLYMVSFSTGALLADAIIHLLPEAVERAGEFTFKISLFVLTGILFSFIVEKFIHWRHCHHTEHVHEHIHPFASMNLFGDGVHNFIDGLIIGASYLVSIPVGLATTIAVILHEIPQEIGDFGVLLHGGFSKKKAILMNFLTALTAVIGTILALIVGLKVQGLTDFLVPFAAGSFIYIAGADLIPELHKETNTKKSFLQLIAFVLGIAIIASMLLFE
ncbi:MAG: ZIP family metal transporter [Candidatus Magasanikbacteria bacterium]|jgi:zinc and cadmium transporter|nr:ZIP family metal transporter [Candidatus Magasanikbacteria bacterium]MBT4314578.1 ZIP family metal transporter [Candidatus Magasanikbacteria bacterium]MBT4546789.1 ZIP family metal transporter [Candidatus Magasanikbacteria bacterium]MBT6818798.1 ZIP family metal transporter [Candidatus Magasanikbacteria bacterium]